MELTPSQSDALTELINIGYARAAAALSDLTGHRISLQVPEVAIYFMSEISGKLEKVIRGEVASVNQVFFRANQRQRHLAVGSRCGASFESSSHRPSQRRRV
jgi:chemotaxis protein CheY-P-specific phosphatase CheC